MAFDNESLTSIRFGSVAKSICGLPILALILCVCTSILLHWDESTSTHCGVSNYLPSVSAAVASFYPENYIWKILISLHITPRFFISSAHKNYLLRTHLRGPKSTQWYTSLCYLSYSLNTAEIFFLLLLTMISSIDDHFLHKCCFIGFVGCSMPYMYLTTYLFDQSGYRIVNKANEKSYQYKFLASTACTISFSLAMYFYWRHNTYCEAGVYTMFALCEYGYIVSNVAFHATVYYEFQDKKISMMAGNNSGNGYDYQRIPTYDRDQDV